MIAILKDTSIYAFGDLLAKGIGFIAIVLYAHFLSQAEIGVYGYILVIVGFANTFLILGIDNAYARYFFEFKTDQQKKVLTTTLFVFTTFWMIVVLLFPLVYSNEITFVLLRDEQYSKAFFLALLTLPLNLLSSMANQALRNQFKTKPFIMFNLLNSALAVGIAVLLLNFTSLGVAAIFLGFIIAGVCVLPLRLYFIRDLFIKQINFRILKKILEYGIPFVPASVAYWVFSSADRVMLERMSTLESVGIYTVAVSLGSIMALVAGAVGQAWSPHAVKAYEEDTQKAKVLYGKFLKALVSVALLLIFLAAVLGKEIINFVFPENYDAVFYPMLFLLMGSGFQMTTQVTAVGISLAKKTIYLVYITLIVAFINILLNYFLIPLYAEKGASFATCVSYLLLTLIYAFVSKKLFPIEYDKRFVLYSIFALLLVFFMTMLQYQYRYLLLFIVLIGLLKNKRKILEFIK